LEKSRQLVEAIRLKREPSDYRSTNAVSISSDRTTNPLPIVAVSINDPHRSPFGINR